jgi:hypothetical protein
MTVYLAGWLSPAPPPQVAQADGAAGGDAKVKEPEADLKAKQPDPEVKAKEPKPDVTPKEPVREVTAKEPEPKVKPEEPGPDIKPKEVPVPPARPAFDFMPPAAPAPPPPKTIIGKASDAPVLDAPRWRVATPVPVSTLAVVPGGKHFVWADVFGTLRLADLGTGQTLRELKGHTAQVFALAVSGDGKLALSGSWDKTACLWDLDRGVLRRKLPPHANKVNSVALSADGSRAVTVERDVLSGPGTVRLWDTAAGQELACQTGTPDSHILRARFFRDDRRVLLTRGWHRQKAGLTLWDPAANQEQQYFDSNQDRNAEALGGLAVSADGEQLLVRVRWSLVVLETRTAKPLREIAVQALTHAGVALSADGQLGACYGGGSTGGRMIDCFAHVFATETGREVCRLRHPSAAFSGAAFTADGRHLLSAAGKELQYWELPAVR